MNTKNAMNAFLLGAQKCKDHKELSDYAGAMVAIGSHLLRGINGDECTEDFLRAAIEDKTKITANLKQ